MQTGPWNEGALATTFERHFKSIPHAEPQRKIKVKGVPCVFQLAQPIKGLHFRVQGRIFVLALKGLASFATPAPLREECF